MDETKYGKYILTKPGHDKELPAWAPPPELLDPPSQRTQMVLLDDSVIKGAFYAEGVWIWHKTVEGGGPRAHVHDFDEVIGFIGTNWEDPFDLGGEVELYLEDEKHILTNTCIVFIPAGLSHCPLEFKRVDSPIFHWSAGPSEGYTGRME
jgi:hypothetical protein